MSDTRSHKHEIELDASPGEVFAALITPSAICGWWGAATAIVLAEEGGFWSAAWGDTDDPDYIVFHRINEFKYPESLVLDETTYHTKFEPLPFEMDSATRFEVEPSGNGGSILRVIQTGFPADPVADDFYAACEKGWHDTFLGMKRFLESRD